MALEHYSLSLAVATETTVNNNHHPVLYIISICAICVLPVRV